MKKYLFLCLLLLIGSGLWAQNEDRTYLLIIWDGPPPHDSVCKDDKTVYTEPFYFEGERYGGYIKRRRADVSTLEMIQENMAPQTIGKPAVFIYNSTFKLDTMPDVCIWNNDIREAQVIPSCEFKSLADLPVPFNIINIVSSGEWVDTLSVYKPGSELMKKSKETITLAEVQKKLAPETRDRPCIFFNEGNLIGEDFDKYRVPKFDAQYIKVIPSEKIRGLKETGDKFYVLMPLPFKPR